jgi:hypothetical protein
VQQETCYARLSGFEQTILSATQKIQALYQNKDNTALINVYRKDFMDVCDGDACDTAVQNLVSAMNGNPGLFGCDLMEILYNGDVNGDYYVGVKDQIAPKAAYILSLIIAGITAQSTYLTI